MNLKTGSLAAVSISTFRGVEGSASLSDEHRRQQSCYQNPAARRESLSHTLHDPPGRPEKSAGKEVLFRGEEQLETRVGINWGG